MRRLIVTADDFGLAVPLNEAVEDAHLRGVLTSASLMVGAAAASDAVERARRLPTLQVGLHVTLVRGRPVLPAREVPALVALNGDFYWNLARAGVGFFFDPRARGQIEREIRAQFEVFRQTGLTLSHADVHNHMHLHPTVLGLVLEIGRDYGLRTIRVPAQPGSNGLLGPWIALLKARLRRHSIAANDFVLGLAQSGAMDTGRVLDLLRRLPDGVTEMYFHPATRSCPELAHHLPGYLCRAEYEALISPAVRQAVHNAGARLISYKDLIQEVPANCSAS